MQFPFTWLKSHRPRNSVGLDIGSHSIKVAIVSRSPGSINLSGCALTELGRSSGQPLPITSVKKAISETMGWEGLDVSDVRIAVSGKGVVVRFAEMPRMSLQELKLSIKYEAELLLPFSLDDCIFDCCVLAPQAEKDRSKMRVLLAAARKGLVQDKLDLLKDVGISPRVVSIDAIALANAFQSVSSGSGEPIVPAKAGSAISLVHIGASQTILTVISGMGLELTRDIEVGGSGATVSISRGLGIDYAEAERLKEAGDPSVNEFISSMTLVLARELRSTFGYVASKLNRNIGRVYLSGGGALCRGLKDLLSAEFGMEASMWDPFLGISPGPEARPPELRGREGVFAVAAGLAMSVDDAASTG